MEFKIDTKETFTIITPITTTISANLADLLQRQCEETRQNGSNNFIIDLQQVNNADTDGIAALADLHELCYSRDESLVFTGINPELMKQFKEDEVDLLLNIAPKMIEAVDIISMEILERDLFGEE